ncbi:MAG: undecaprenyl-diphosphate phosphatase [Patescibacteria group bacterium]|jgi:undecaprenyl-diphosphatase
MTLINSLILGLIEGLTEFLPISSTAHLILAGEWLRIPSSEFLKTFNISIQLGAILAVVILYWKKIWSSWSLILKIGAAFVATSIIGLALYKIVKSYLMENLPLIAGALLLGGLAIIVLEKYYSRQPAGRVVNNNAPLVPEADLSAISYRQALGIGIFQSLAIVPGVSRSAATILGGLSLGISRKNIVEFSFLLAIPTMAAATGLDLYESRALLSGLSGSDLAIWAAGFVTAFITAIIGVRFFLKFIQKNNFAPFGWYRIALGCIVFLWIWLK